MSRLLTEFRVAVRMLQRAPVFTVVTVLVLALGIGANTAIFTLVQRVLLAPLPYPDPGRLVNIWETNSLAPPQYPALPVNPGNFLEWRNEQHVFEHLALMENADFDLTGWGAPRHIDGVETSGELFAMLGVHPLLGRFFTPSEQAFGHDREIVLTWGLWQQLFHGDRRAIGQTLTLSSYPYTVIGVLPKNFYLPRLAWLSPMPGMNSGQSIQFFKPLGLRSWNMKAGAGGYNDIAIAQLKPGISLTQARAQLQVLQQRIAQSTHTPARMGVVVQPLAAAVTRTSRGSLRILMAGAVLLLLLVCASLANLLLARNSGRIHEIAVRAALGASRGQLLRQLLVETGLLALAGGALGIWLAAASLPLLAGQARWGLPRLLHLSLNLPIMLYALGIILLTALLVGAWPAWRLSRLALHEGIRSSGPTATARRQAFRVREWLTTAEVSIAALLLVVALLLSVSLARVLRDNRIFLTEHVLTLPLNASATANAPQRVQFYRTVVEKAGALPGVRTAGLVNFLPLQGVSWFDQINVRGIPFNPKDGMNVRWASRDYFRATGIPLISGAMFPPDDQNVAIISENMVRQVFHGRNPIGMQIRYVTGKKPWMRIVGVAADVRTRPDRPAPMTVYFPYQKQPWMGYSLAVRVTGSVPAAEAGITGILRRLAPGTPLEPPKTMATVLASANRARGFQAFLTTAFALCAGVLAMLGLYGVISTAVFLRRREIAIRMVLGAGPRQVRTMVMSRLGRLAAIGLAAGLFGAWLTARLLGSFLYGISPANPWVYLSVAAVLAATAALAGAIPARRASRQDPSVALHAE